MNKESTSENPCVSPLNDRVWKERKEVWGLAIRLRRELLIEDTKDSREKIIYEANKHLHWSIWKTVFDGDLGLIKMLNEAELKWKGTHLQTEQDCSLK